MINYPIKWAANFVNPKTGYIFACKNKQFGLKHKQILQVLTIIDWVLWTKQK